MKKTFKNRRWSLILMLALVPGLLLGISPAMAAYSNVVGELPAQVRAMIQLYMVLFLIGLEVLAGYVFLVRPFIARLQEKRRQERAVQEQVAQEEAYQAEMEGQGNRQLVVVGEGSTVNGFSNQREMLMESRYVAKFFMLHSASNSKLLGEQWGEAGCAMFFPIADGKETWSGALTARHVEESGIKPLYESFLRKWGPVFHEGVNMWGLGAGGSGASTNSEYHWLTPSSINGVEVHWTDIIITDPVGIPDQGPIGVGTGYPDHGPVSLDDPDQAIQEPVWEYDAESDAQPPVPEAASYGQVLDPGVEKVRSALLQVETPLGTCSGVVVEYDGLAVTGHRVVEDDSAVQLTLPSGKRRVGNVALRAPELDLAVLHLEGIKVAPPHLGDPRDVEVGDEVLVLSLGFAGSSVRGVTVFRGTVTGVEFDYRGDVKSFETDLPGQPGGAALSTLDGQLIGIMTAEDGMAVSINLAQGLWEQVQLSAAPAA